MILKLWFLMLQIYERKRSQKTQRWPFQTWRDFSPCCRRNRFVDLIPWPVHLVLHLLCWAAPQPLHSHQGRCPYQPHDALFALVTHQRSDCSLQSSHCTCQLTHTHLWCVRQLCIPTFSFFIFVFDFSFWVSCGSSNSLTKSWNNID